jgi:RNA polymerase sigma-70 factor, ECF subfamily
MAPMALTTDTAWAELHANIRGFVARRVRRPADVDDIVQQVFLRVHQALPTLRNEDKLPAWIYRTTRRAIADYYRAPARREVSVGTAVDVVSAEQPEAAVDEREASALQELAACLKPLIGTLAPADREALVLVEFDGVPQVDAARRVGLSASGMKSRVQRARARLRSAFDECCRIALDARGGVLEYERRIGQCGGSGCDTDPAP